MSENAKSLTGYKNYDFYEDGRVVEISTGKQVKANKKGMIALTDDAGKTGIKNIADIIAAISDKSTSSDGVTSESGATSESGDSFDLGEAAAPVVEDAEKAAYEAKLSEKRKALKEATKRLVTAKKDDLIAARDNYDAVEKDLADFKAANAGKVASTGGAGRKAAEPKEQLPLTPEQIEAQEKYDAAKAAYDEAKKELDEAATALRAFKPIKGTGDNASHAPKMSYRDAQLVRQMYAIGRFPEYPGEKKKISEIEQHFGISASAINYYINYLQHKLRRAPKDADMTDPENIIMYTAFTPLVNDYYLADWTSKDGVVCHGAPYAEDGITETADRYKRKANQGVGLS